jgi:hypothetical protein
MGRNTFMFAWVIILISFSCNPSSSSTAAASQLPADYAEALTGQAYIYGFPDLFVHHDLSGRSRESKWLPNLKDGATLTMRIFWPKEEFLNGTCKISTVKKI